LSQLANQKVARGLATALIIMSLFWVFFNESRPLILNSKIIEEHRIENIFNTSRIEQYFINIPHLREPYNGAVDFLKSQNCRNIGLSIGGNTWEYPFWMLLQEEVDLLVRLEHINVNNESAVTAKDILGNNFTPCAIIASETEEVQSQKITNGDRVYRQEWSKDSVSVFLQDSFALTPSKL
jgi:hypothetical protein